LISLVGTERNYSVVEAVSATSLETEAEITSIIRMEAEIISIVRNGDRYNLLSSWMETETVSIIRDGSRDSLYYKGGCRNSLHH
jgi:peptidase E